MVDLYEPAKPLRSGSQDMLVERVLLQKITFLSVFYVMCDWCYNVAYISFMPIQYICIFVF